MSEWMAWWLLMLPVAALWYFLRKPRRGSQRLVRPLKPSQTPVSRETFPSGLEPGSPVRETENCETPVAQGLPDALAGFVLMRRETLNKEQQAHIHSLVTSMQRPHPMFAVLTAARDDDEALMNQITSDPGLSATALKTVNSSAFGLSMPIESVQRAVAYLGLNYVRGLIVEAAMAPALKLASHEQTIAARRLWNAGAISSAVALALTQQLGIAGGSVMATHALLSRIGDLCLASQCAELVDGYLPGTTLLSRIERQQSELNLNAMVVGSALAEEWGLPPGLQSSLANVLLPLTVPPVDHPLQGEMLRNSVLIYVAYWIGEHAVFAGERDVGLIDLYSPGTVELYYLPEYLQHCGLGGITALLANPSVRRSLNRLLGHFSM